MALSISEMDEVAIENAERLFGELCFHVKVFKEEYPDRAITDFYFQKRNLEEAEKRYREFRKKQYRDFEHMELWLAEPVDHGDSISFTDVTKLRG